MRKTRNNPASDHQFNWPARIAVTVLCSALVLGALALPVCAQTCSQAALVSGAIDAQGEKIHGSTNWMAQSFVAPGTPGDCIELNEITVEICKLGATANLVFEVHQATAGIPSPGASPIGSASLTPSAVTTTCTNGPVGTYGPVDVTFSPAVKLVAGTKYAFVAHQAGNAGDGTHFYRIGVISHPGQPDPDYTGGAYCKWNSGTAVWDCPGNNATNNSGSLDTKLSVCTTSVPCTAGCTYTQGFWKNHPAAWPVNSLTLGSVTYTKNDLLDILGTPVQGNGLVSLAHQLIAAKLNIANGADGSVIASTIAAADALIGSLVVPPIGSGSLDPAATSALTGALDNYNKGVTGPGHCN